jgi:hypothetical protein
MENNTYGSVKAQDRQCPRVIDPYLLLCMTLLPQELRQEVVHLAIPHGAPRNPSSPQLLFGQLICCTGKKMDAQSKMLFGTQHGVSPATRLLEMRRQMFEVQETLEEHKAEFNRKVPLDTPQAIQDHL